MVEEYIPWFRRETGRVRTCLGRIYALLVVVVGFVFFRADTFGQALYVLRQMVTGWHFDLQAMQLTWSVLPPLTIVTFLAAIIGATPWPRRLLDHRPVETLSWAGSIVLLLLCILSLASGTYNPFLYFRF